MMRTINAEEFAFAVPTAEGQRSWLFEVRERTGVQMDIRCDEEVTLNGITTNGETVFLDRGRVVAFTSRLVGFSALEIVASKAFAYRSREKSRWREIPDPTRMVVEPDVDAGKPMSDLVKEELKKYLAKLDANKSLASDVDVEELFDDIEQGDLEFEQEADPFGLGYSEPEPQEEGRTTAAPRKPVEPRQSSVVSPAEPKAAEPAAPAEEVKTGPGA